jgi:hypothetical protein
MVVHSMDRLARKLEDMRMIVQTQTKRGLEWNLSRMG